MPDSVVAVLVGLATTALVWIRLPDLARNTLWAEDGRTFLQERILDGPFASLNNPYDGYLHLVPRVITSALYPLVPLESYAAAITVACAVVTGVVGAIVYVCSRAVVTWLPARVALGLLVVLAPVAPIEVLGNTANLHWVLLWAAPWLMIARYRSWPASVAGALAILVIALTEIQALGFAPLLLLQWRDRRHWPVAAGLLIGGGAQIITTLTNPRNPRAGDKPDALGLVKGYLINPTLGTVTNSKIRGAELLERFGWGLPIVLLVVFVLLAAYVVSRGSGTLRALVVMLLAGSVAIWCASVLVNRSRVDAVWIHNFQFQRYAYVTSLFLLAMAPLAAAELYRRGWRWPAWALFAVLAVGLAVNVRTDDVRRLTGPDWRTSIEQADTTCRTTDAPAIRIQIAPARPVWKVSFSCPTVERLG